MSIDRSPSHLPTVIDEDEDVKLVGNKTEELNSVSSAG